MPSTPICLCLPHFIQGCDRVTVIYLQPSHSSPQAQTHTGGRTHTHTHTHTHSDSYFPVLSHIYSTNLPSYPTRLQSRPILRALGWDSLRDSLRALGSRDQEDWNWSFLFGPAQPSLASCHLAPAPQRGSVTRQQEEGREKKKKKKVSFLSATDENVSLLFTTRWQIKSVVVWLWSWLSSPQYFTVVTCHCVASALRGQMERGRDKSPLKGDSVN